MLIIMYKNHKIEIDHYPQQIILYDGNEVSKKAVTRSNKHIVNFIEDGEEVQYEVFIDAMITQYKQDIMKTLQIATMTSLPFEIHWKYDIRRNGQILYYNSYIFLKDDLYQLFMHEGHKIEIYVTPKKEIINYDGKEVSRKDFKYKDLIKLNLSIKRSPSIHKFKVNENNEDVEYEFSITPNYSCEFRKNGKTIITQDTSMTKENFKIKMELALKLIKIVASASSGIGIPTTLAEMVSIPEVCGFIKRKK